jgi:hypothetical protein
MTPAADTCHASSTVRLGSPHAGVIDLSPDPDTATVTCVFPQCRSVSCDVDEPTEAIAAYLEDHRIRVHGQPARPGRHLAPVRDLRPLFGPGPQVGEGWRAA